MRIYSFLEWAEYSIRNKVICMHDKRFCLPNSNEEVCIKCYDGYVKTCIPEYCKED